MEGILTLQNLKDMQPGLWFATGLTTDSPGGINMSWSGKELKWVAVRGDIWDWAIYIHFAEWSIRHVASNGDKVTFESHIKKLVPCDDEAFKMYRY